MKWSEMNMVGKIHRLSHLLYLKKIPFLPKILMSINRIVFSCDIPYRAKIHPTVMFGHNGLGVVVHPNTPIGKNSLIMQGVTLGGAKGGKRREHEGKVFTCPIIGENVFIGPGVTIIGPVIVGDNAQIGAGAVVMNDVPRNGIAVGIPAKTIKILDDDQIVSAKN